jgi:hypothetical protein
MIRRLVDVDYLQNRENATATQAVFWLKELRSSSLLIECVSNWNELTRSMLPERKAVLTGALELSQSLVEQAFDEERIQIRKEDALYWSPIQKELEELRHGRRD